MPRSNTKGLDYSTEGLEKNRSIPVYGGQMFRNRTNSEFLQNFEEISSMKPEVSPLCLSQNAPKSDFRILFYDPVANLHYGPIYLKFALTIIPTFH